MSVNPMMLKPREDGENGHGAARRASLSRAVVTIVSGNYIARARVLCRSLAEHEPNVRRFVLIVDRPVSTIVRKDEPFEVIRVEDLEIPDFEDFMAQYTVIEANTAVKPYVLRHLFGRFGIDSLVYLDPDILVTAPLNEVWSALDRGPVVLTPHLRDPFRDLEHPTELEILRSGTYNLGFIGLRRGESAERLIDWWAEKTEHDCAIDMANGLFVDQKWMDLVPGYIEGVVVLRDPGYNVAYWNLHEREVTESSGTLFVDGRPLAFYHFSGYEPDRPWILSRHQSRHDLHPMPVLKRLFDSYAASLREEGHNDAVHRRYGYSALSNGIPISPVIRSAVRDFRKRKIRYPTLKNADEFCHFLMTPNASVSGTEISPFTHHVLARRGDVASAFPAARYDAQDPGFHNWLKHSGHECDAELLFARFGHLLGRINAFSRIARIYDVREDLRTTYPDAFRTQDGLDGFVAWLRWYGVRETPINREDIDTLVHTSRTGFESVLEYYLANKALHAQFPLALLPCDDHFINWLIWHGTREAHLDVAQIRWFEHRRRTTDVNELLLLTALRNEWVRQRFPLGATVFGWQELCTWAHATAKSRGFELRQLADEPPDRIPIELQIEALHTTNAYPNHPDAMCSRIALRSFSEVIVASSFPPLRSRNQERLERAIAAYSPRAGVNVAGYFHYAAGVGTLARSVTRGLDAVGIPHQDVTLPVVPSGMTSFDPDSTCLPQRVWEQHRLDYGVNITVANADAMAQARAFLGPSYDHCRRHIAYWVWETDCLPGKFADEAEGLDAIWTCSEFSARSLRKTIDPGIRVDVVPCCVAPPAPGDPRRLPVSLPKGRTLIGFFFDARSVVERKNPADLLRAFRRAFRADDKVSLVLKVNHPKSAPDVMRKLEALADGLSVIWLHDLLLDDVQTSTLIDRLDIYASLHRAEGFGLVLAEAMALGKVVVATGFSANTEFMDDRCSRLVRCREIVTDRAHGPYPRGTRWAEPDVEHASEILRSLAFSRDLRADIGREARQSVRQRLAPQAVGQRVCDLLGWDHSRRATTTVSSEPGEAGTLSAALGLAASSE
jgi:glycosyltransferase involved in cell wall biosynthesis